MSGHFQIDEAAIWAEAGRNQPPLPQPSIRSQIVVLKVFYEDDDEVALKEEPAKWNWSVLIDEPIRDGVEVLAAGPVVDYPRPGEEDA